MSAPRLPEACTQECSHPKSMIPIVDHAHCPECSEVFRRGDTYMIVDPEPRGIVTYKRSAILIHAQCFQPTDILRGGGRVQQL